MHYNNNLLLWSSQGKYDVRAFPWNADNDVDMLLPENGFHMFANTWYQWLTTTKIFIYKAKKFSSELNLLLFHLPGGKFNVWLYGALLLVLNGWKEIIEHEICLLLKLMNKWLSTYFIIYMCRINAIAGNDINKQLGISHIYPSCCISKLW